MTLAQSRLQSFAKAAQEMGYLELAVSLRKEARALGAKRAKRGGSR